MALDYLVFNTEAEAIAAESKIAINMGITGNITSKWTDVKAYNDKYILQKPDSKFLDGVTGYDIQNLAL